MAVLTCSVACVRVESTDESFCRRGDTCNRTSDVSTGDRIRHRGPGLFATGLGTLCCQTAPRRASTKTSLRTRTGKARLVSVGFSSKTDAIMSPSSGQSRIQAQGEAQGNYLDQISVFSLLSGNGFSELEFNINALSTGEVFFEATNQFGAVETFTRSVAEGENFFVFYTDAVQTILKALDGEHHRHHAWFR